MKVGTIVKLKKYCLTSDRGSLGVCYEVYTIGEHQGASFIFENGDYDGFSIDDQKAFLEEIGFCKSLSNYEFKHVIKLSNDYENGDFDEGFKI